MQINTHQFCPPALSESTIHLLLMMKKLSSNLNEEISNFDSGGVVMKINEMLTVSKMLPD